MKFARVKGSRVFPLGIATKIKKIVSKFTPERESHINRVYAQRAKVTGEL
jgi:hypothetical protein